MEKWDGDNKHNINNHSGYEIKDLFVERKFDTFKHELMNYTDLNIKHYHQTVLPKLNQYMQTYKFRATSPNIPYDIYANMASKDAKESYDFASHSVKLLYDIWRETLSEEHLLALILYCDFSELCSSFSASLRPMNPFEPLSSIRYEI